NSRTAIGLRVNGGIVLFLEKLVHSKLLVPGSNRRIQSVDRHIGMATAGLLADGRHLASRAFDEALNYRETYRAPTTLKALTRNSSWNYPGSALKQMGCASLYQKTCMKRRIREGGMPWMLTWRIDTGIH
ncbi:nucleophile aminohydrolase, partial [Cantharellus anzutake]|uniref:nucleophile aminohydrolase n=1 Tax=Cantharellus anzutake TaxID=1750568 RepID=UPI001904A3BC